MSSRDPVRVTSRDNPLLVALRKLSSDPAGYRRGGAIWVEGEHLCQAVAEHGRPVAQALVTDTAWDEQPALRALAEHAARICIVPESLFGSVSGLESHGRIGFLLEYTPATNIEATAPTVVLDRLQDAGNVGTILRTAAAFGVSQVLALKGTAALWSPKVMRAGMGAHFALSIVESLDEGQLSQLRVPLLAGSSHAAVLLGDVDLPAPCAWVFGHEGQGVGAALMARCAMTIAIPQPGGEESLNVASAAAVCLYESMRQRRQLARTTS